MNGESGVVVGLIENRAKEIGLAAFDLRTAGLSLWQYIESSRSYQITMTLLHFLSPTVIVVTASHNPSSERMMGMNAILNSGEFAGVKRVHLSRSCFDDTRGMMLVQTLALNGCQVQSLQSYSRKYYLCLGATTAVLKWIEGEKGVLITDHSVKVTFSQLCDHMNIDLMSVQNLELIEVLSNGSSHITKRSGSLFGILNKTKTVGGARLLRANLLQPLKDIETINTRLDCMDELMCNEKLFFGLCQVLQKFPKDIDRILCHFCFKQKQPEDCLGTANIRRSQALVASVILLKEALELLTSVLEILKLAESSILRNIREAVCSQPGYNSLYERIRDVIDEDVLHAKVPFVARTQQCFAVKAGIDGFLDVARKIFCDTTEAIHNLAKRYREEYNLPNLKMLYNSKGGFYITIPEKDLHQVTLPKIFIQVVKRGKNVHCSTSELTSLNVRNTKAAAECYSRTELCLEDLLNHIREEIPILSLLSESISLIDMLVNAFAFMVSSKPPGSYSRPEFTEHGPVVIEAGRHPILDSLCPGDFVANNTFLSEASNMIIVTGPNMSGKTTYLHQVALIAVLAHVGCYVPAHYSSFRIIDSLFTRIGTGDDLEFNSSTFMTEMRELAFILPNLSSRSMVLIDELGRSTSSSDGVAIAWSCCEYLLSLKVYVIFATHMKMLVELPKLYPNVKVCYFVVALKFNNMDFKFMLKEGCTNIPNYGLLLGELAGLPPSVVTDARQITKRITDNERNHANVSNDPSLNKDYRIAQKLLSLKYSSLSEAALRSYLKELKDNYFDGKLN